MSILEKLHQTNVSNQAGKELKSVQNAAGSAYFLGIACFLNTWLGLALFFLVFMWFYGLAYAGGKLFVVPLGFLSRFVEWALSKHKIASIIIFLLWILPLFVVFIVGQLVEPGGNFLVLLIGLICGSGFFVFGWWLSHGHKVDAIRELAEGE
ncbi:EscU/YscU/HrcU family type III secretion system export apparatus switch protein [Acidithiobacillus sp. CV18-2]|nr:EscU/YscU/HrcU family type III secretion system export apparatus switch protein [Acidithiobacillus sp. CV18-3]MBU2778226.1 EscU/YscU/HrcU family type III secretion system export apparatus switch protein [Acidithiobacillus sp. CV18-2]MBU2799099.1 EscU/YscU/HrcU family type III secretion system export apparatus switch protein [Acidithiobacillus sp. VAN18-4]